MPIIKGIHSLAFSPGHICSYRVYFIGEKEEDSFCLHVLCWDQQTVCRAVLAKQYEGCYRKSS